MATFSKQLHMINSSGTEQTAAIYSTADEAGSPYLNATVDGETGYIALVDVSDTSATSGRVQLASGAIYAIGKANVPAYSYQFLDTVGGGTFTVPSGVSKLRVTCVGGGAGGADLGASNNDSAASNSNASLRTVYIGGGATTFGSVAAAGATDGVNYYYNYTYTGTCYTSGRDRTAYDCTKTATGVQNVTTPAGYNAGWYGYSRGWRSGASATPLTDYNGTQIGTAGAGGGWDSYNDSNYGYCGGSGYLTVSTITVSAGQVISYTVGAGGNGFIWGGYYSSCHGNTGSPSGSVCPGSGGAILVEWGKGIE